MKTEKKGSNTTSKEYRKYEMELYVFLTFYIKSALISIEYLKEERMNGVFEDKAQYYHYHLLNLSTAMGLIHDRFIPVHYIRANLADFLVKMRACYHFSKQEYPNITNKNVRNFFQHTNERNYWLIKTEHIFAAFNILEASSNRENKIKRFRYNSYFDVEKLQYNYYDQKFDQRFVLDIRAVEEELVLLEKRNIAMQKQIYGAYSKIN